MTRGKLLGNNATLFIFISILIMTQLISFLHFLLTAVRTGRLGVLSIKINRGNNAVFGSVDLIGEKNQVILEWGIIVDYTRGSTRQYNPAILLPKAIDCNPRPIGDQFRLAIFIYLYIYFFI